MPPDRIDDIRHYWKLVSFDCQQAFELALLVLAHPTWNASRVRVIAYAKRNLPIASGIDYHVCREILIELDTTGA